MPSVKLSAMYQNKLMQERIYGKMQRLNISQTQIAKKLGITQSAFSRKAKNMNFNLDELRIVFGTLQFSEKEIIESMKEVS